MYVCKHMLPDLRAIILVDTLWVIARRNETCTHAPQQFFLDIQLLVNPLTSLQARALVAAQG